jgi:hypothetical protein
MGDRTEELPLPLLGSFHSANESEEPLKRTGIHLLHLPFHV